MVLSWIRKLINRTSTPRRAGSRRFRPGLETVEDRLLLAAGSLGFLALDMQVAENAGNVQISVLRTGGSDGTVTVLASTHDETAQAPVNYTATSVTLTFGPGQTLQTFAVPIFNVGQLDGNKVFGLQLTNPTGGAALQPLQSASNVTIVNANGTPAQRFVNDVYLEVLHRNADPGGLAFFAPLLPPDGGTEDQRTLVVSMVQGSPEGRMVFVEDLYITLLGREADPGGLNTFVTFLNNGGTQEAVKAAILGSEEYFRDPSLGAGDNQTWLESVYLDVLGRLPDDSGQALFLQALNSGASRTQIALSILTSSEAHGTLVQDFYLNLLNRTPDPSGFSFWVSVLDHGGREEQVMAGFIASPEYLDRV